MIQTRLELTGNIDVNLELKGELNEAIKYLKPVTQEKTVTPTKDTQSITPDTDFTGLSKVTVKPIPDEYIIPDGTLEVSENGDIDVSDFKTARVGVYTSPNLQDKEITPTKEIQDITYDNEYDGLNKVIVNAIPDDYIKPTGTKDILTNGYYQVLDYEGVNVNVETVPNLQDKEVTPTKDIQTVVADEEFDGLSIVEIKPIPENYIEPTGTIEIKTKGTHDVTQYANAEVDVLPTLQTKEVTPTKELQVVGVDEEYDGLDAVVVNPIPDNYIEPNGTIEITSNGTHNVKEYENANINVPDPVINLQDKSITITENGTQNIVADEGYDGLNSVEVVTNVAGGSEPVVEPDYITDGLVAWWDGEDAPDNNNHWVSRLGDDYISQYTTALGTTDVHTFAILHSTKEKCYRNNMMYGLTTNKDYLVQGYTVEVVGKATNTANNTAITSTDGGATLLGFDKQNSPYICITGTNGWFAPLNNDASSITPVKYEGLYNKRCTFALNLEQTPARGGGYATVQVGYSVNGKDWLYTTPKSCSKPSTDRPNLSIMCYYRNTYFSCCEINSIRIYNRKLTEEELKHNYEVDKARFNLDEYTG